MTVRLGIGDFSRMTQLSVIALRHYHEVGLLTPAEIDEQSGYRFYEPAQVQIAQAIRRFRDLGMPLDQIAEVLRAPDVPADGRPAGPRAALYPAAFFELGAGEVVAYIPVAGHIAVAGRAEVLQIPAAELAVAVHTGTLADVDQTYGALGIYVAERGLGAEGPIREHYLVTQFDTDDESDLVTEVCWPVSAPSALPGPARSAMNLQ